MAGTEGQVLRTVHRLVVMSFMDFTESPIILAWCQDPFDPITNYYHPPTELREGNVFSRVCPLFCLSTGEGVPMWPLPMTLHTSLYRLLALLPWTSDLGPPSPPQTWDPCPQLVTNTGDLFKLVHFEDPRSSIWWWPLKHIWFVSGRYTSYWNAFLFLKVFTDLKIKSCTILYLLCWTQAHCCYVFRRNALEKIPTWLWTCTKCHSCNITDRFSQSVRSAKCASYRIDHGTGLRSRNTTHEQL